MNLVAPKIVETQIRTKKSRCCSSVNPILINHGLWIRFYFTCHVALAETAMKSWAAPSSGRKTAAIPCQHRSFHLRLGCEGWAGWPWWTFAVCDIENGHRNRWFTPLTRVLNSVWYFFLAQVLDFLFGFLSWYHLPCICNSLELESVILHGIRYVLAWLLCILYDICYMLAWLLCILHGICYIWPCSPSILHGICNVLALQPLICMVFATFWYFKRSCGFHVGFL